MKQPKKSQFTAVHIILPLSPFQSFPLAISYAALWISVPPSSTSPCLHSWVHRLTQRRVCTLTPAAEHCSHLTLPGRALPGTTFQRTVFIVRLSSLCLLSQYLLRIHPFKVSSSFLASMSLFAQDLLRQLRLLTHSYQLASETCSRENTQQIFSEGFVYTLVPISFSHKWNILCILSFLSFWFYFTYLSCCPWVCVCVSVHWFFYTLLCKHTEILIQRIMMKKRKIFHHLLWNVRNLFGFVICVLYACVSLCAPHCHYLLICWWTLQLVPFAAMQRAVVNMDVHTSLR